MRRLVLSTLLAGFAASVAGGALAAQQIVGRVVSTTEVAALAGAKVTVVATHASTVTDREGYFGFKNVPAGKITLQVQKDGYVTMVEDVDVDGDGVTLVRFEIPAIGAFLKGFTVTGHRKSDADASGDAVIQGGSHGGRDRTAMDLLAYRVPGLVVTTGDGGQGVRVLIRGVSSLSLNNDPVVYVDGVKVHALDQLEEISANDVQEIRVLKGAASATLYPDGANGVILIETRRGARTGGGPEPPNTHPWPSST